MKQVLCKSCKKRMKTENQIVCDYCHEEQAKDHEALN